MNRHGATRAVSGWVLVAIQGVLFAGIALWPASWGGVSPVWRVVGVVLIAMGAVVLTAAAVFLGRALTPHPDPNGTGLTSRGIYQWVRHPMYVGVVAACAGIASLRGVAAAWVLTCALALFFEAKTRREERQLVAAYPGYAQYAMRTGKYLPGLGKLAPPGSRAFGRDDLPRGDGIL